MKQYKIIITVGSIIGLCVLVGGIYPQQLGTLSTWWDNVRPKGKQIIDIRPAPPKRVDKLFTGFVYMPLLDLNKENTTIEGLCLRQYEVGIGYNDIWKLFDQYHEAACQNNIQTMPEPIILSTNTVKTELHGNYYQKSVIPGMKTIHQGND